LSPNQPCWVAGVYNGDYSGTTDIDYIGPPAQASGGHPFVGVTDFTMATTSPAVSSIRVVIPPGLVSNPLATPKCADAELTAGACPTNTQLGIVKLEASDMGLPVYAIEDVYNMPVESECSGYVSDYAFYVSLTKERVDICGSVNKQPPYNLYFTIAVPAGAATVSSTLIFWGMPGDSGHDPQRGKSCLNLITPCAIPASGPSSPSGTPFLTNPTACLPAGQVSTLTLGGGGEQATVSSKTPVPAIDCSSLAFSPQLTLALTGKHQTAVGKHPTLVANLSQAPGQANITTSTLTLPLSLALDPNNSQNVCSVGDAANDSCPSNTQIGSATATTPLLTQPLSGPVYLVQGVRTVDGVQIRTLPAILVELRGQAAIDLHAQTSVSHNRLVTTFSSLPDLPESSFTLTVSGGSKGILVVTGHKSLCSGKQVASSVFVGHNGASEQAKIKMTTPCKAPKKHKHRKR
jgi:hypothetical protein